MSKAKHYWCVKVPEEISSNGEIYLHADTAEIINGDLIFKKGDMIIFSVGRINWTVFFAASVIDGHAVYVEHWKGEEHAGDY